MQFFSTPHYGAHDFALFYEALHIDSASRSKAVCNLLDISAKTLKNYLTGKATPPKAAVRLLFHESFYGRAATDEDTHQGQVLAQREAQGLRAEIVSIKTHIAAIEAENDALKRSNDQPGIAANSSRWYA